MSVLAFGATDSRPVLMISREEAERMKAAARGREAVLGKFADSALRAGPWSVTFQRPQGITAAKGAQANDYYSEGPYWWPDPKDPKGPYIRKDGERNPDRFERNRRDLGSICEAVLSLGMGAFLLGRLHCKDRAEEVLRVWFLDAKTRMNPHLEFGQAIRGRNSGRGTGIIDTVSMIHAVQGIMLLEQAGLDPALASGLREWFTQYLKWLTTSEKGLDEKKARNNHGSWWTAQVAAYATFTGDAPLRRMAWEQFRTFIVPGQVQADGSCPLEEARTQSLSYSSMNLDAYAVICRLAERDGVDLWRFRSKGVGFENCVQYLMPYLLDPGKWKKQQISTYTASGYVFPGLAARGLKSAELLTNYEKLPRNPSPWVQFVDLLVRS